MVYRVIRFTLICTLLLSYSRVAIPEEEDTPCRGDWTALSQEERTTCTQEESEQSARDREAILNTITRIQAMIKLLQARETLSYLEKRIDSEGIQTQLNTSREGVKYDKDHNEEK